jgi:hypothetical protein
MGMPQPSDTAFGAGCFVLSPRAKAPFQLTGGDYLRQVSETLTLAQGIADVEVSAAPYFDKESYSFDTPITPLDAGPTDFPPSDCDLWISFRVHILARIQTQILRDTSQGWQTDETLPEDFIVTMTTGFDSPVAFVEPTDLPTGYDPSRAVIVVREYLKRELGDNPTAPLRFECLGPSPFHAQFRLQAFRQRTPTAVRPADWSWQSTYAGYEDITITYNPAVLPTLADAQGSVYMSLREQLSIGYYAIQVRLELEHIWDDLERKVNSLADMHRRGGVKAYFGRTFRVPQELLNATLALTDYELKELTALRSVQSVYQSHYDHETHPCVAKQVQEYVNQVKPLPVDQFKRLIELFDRYRAERFAGLNVLISAILGGLVGAVLTAFASRIVAGSGH